MDRSLKHVMLSTLLIGSFGFDGVARADIMSVDGSTTGVFLDSSDASVGNAISHLTFTGTNFGPINSDQTLTLGTFDLNNGTTNYTGLNYTFDLTVTFTTPAGASGNSVIANLTGSVHGNDGSATVDFPAGGTLFTFPTGAFDLTVNDLTVDLSSNAGVGTLTGTLSNVTNRSESAPAVPEPGSVVLLLTVVAGVMFSLRRKRIV